MSLPSNLNCRQCFIDLRVFSEHNFIHSMGWSIRRAAMTGGNADITVLWEGLKNGSLFSGLDNLPVYLGSRDGLHHVARLLSCCLPLVFLSVCFLAFSRSRKEHDMRTRAALSALLTIVAPTCSLWPSRYIKLASVLGSHIRIPLEMITEDATNGVIEFRNPIHDLADLIGSGAAVNGHTIRIIVGWKWWINYFEWRMLAKPKSDYPGPSPCLPGYLPGLSNVNKNMPSADSSPLCLPLVLFALNPSTSCPSFCLDHLPDGITPSLNKGCKATLEFTTFSPSLRALSPAQIISAVPFILSERFPRKPRTLLSVLKQLSASYGPNVVIDSVSNISVDHEHTLRHVYGSFFGEQKIRDTCVKGLGVREWRRDMFLVALEAALLRRGWIERWAVRVIAK